MNKKEVKKQSKVLTFRLPLPVYEAYEKYCIEEQIYMASILKEAIQSKLKEKEKIMK